MLSITTFLVVQCYDLQGRNGAAKIATEYCQYGKICENWGKFENSCKNCENSKFCAKSFGILRKSYNMLPDEADVSSRYLISR